MPLPPQNHRISLADAAALTRRQREQAPRPAVNACAFHADQVKELLDQKGVVALRIYYARDAAGNNTMVLVGVDSNDNELTGGIVLNYGLPCPPFCTDNSALNR